MPGLSRLFILIFLVATPAFFHAQVTHPDLAYNTYLTGFSNAVDIANAGDGTNRLFVVERFGYIKVVENDVILGTDFLNISNMISNSPNERGLLGLAFHPDFKNNGYFYINYTRLNGDTRVSRFSVDPGNPNVADPNSEFVIMTIDQPEWNHNGGCVRFGPDGYLYIGMGDGGGSGDPNNLSQNPQELLGKMLRIDVDGGTPYAIPPDNPFVNDPGTLDEIWALGLRNPWRYSFDRLTGDLWIGDVGQNAWEEIDFQPVSSSGGENYGWRCYEGNAPYNSSGCLDESNYVAPVYEYDHSLSNGGLSLTGGIVYRGEEYSCLQGFYIFADAYYNNFWTLAPDGNGGWDAKQHNNISPEPSTVVSYGEDEAGELYAVGLGGTIYRVTTQAETLEIPDPVASTLYSSEHDIISDGTVLNGSVTDFEARDGILLNAGFEVELGADFDAFCSPCVPPSN